MKKVYLCDNWQLIGEKIGEIKAEVPGCVHTDLMKNGLLPDIYWRDNNIQCQWIEECDWDYRCCFDAEPSQAVTLVFDGLDTYADIYLNGEKIGSCDNMFVPVRLDVSNKLYEKNNLLEVRFRSPVKEVEGKPELRAAFTAERLHTRRVQCTYGWDWVDRFVTCGIYRPVYLEYTNGMYVDCAYVCTESIDKFSAQLYTEIEFKNYESGELVCVEIISPDGKTAARNDFFAKEPLVSRRFDIADPQLWYPSGYGEQPLYTLKITVGNCCHTEIFGIRTVKIVQLEDVEGSEYYDKSICVMKNEIGSLYSKNKTFYGFQVLVNGIPVLCKGANWVPCEPFPSAETDEKFRLLISQAKQMNLNMLRVWGGGIFENKTFYDECDKNGILVAQDFLMACGFYPEKEEWFIEALRNESEYAVKLLRNHPCIAWWHGDNENAQWGSDTQTDYTGRDTAYKGIAPQIRKFDRMRAFLPSSPYGGDYYSSLTSGTAHISNYCCEIFDYFNYKDCRDYKEFFSMFTARFISEEPTFGASPLSSMLRFMTSEDLFEDETENILRYHTKTNPALERHIYDDIKAFTQKVLGSFTDGHDRFFKYKYIQYEWIRIVFELCRRDLGYCNGMIFWMFNDCWPAALGWSLIDYYSVPKAAYYSFRRCAQHVVSSVTSENNAYTVTVSNDSNNNIDVKGKAYLLDRRNGSQVCEEYEFEAKVGAYGNSCITLPWKCEDWAMVVCDISHSDGIDRAFYLDGNLPLVPASDEVEVVSCDENSITLKAKSYVHAVEIEGKYTCSDNYFSMMAGETRRVEFERKVTDLPIDLQVIAYTVKSF